jgi:hypothetical protein
MVSHARSGGTLGSSTGAVSGRRWRPRRHVRASARVSQDESQEVIWMPAKKKATKKKAAKKGGKKKK